MTPNSTGKLLRNIGVLTVGGWIVQILALVAQVVLVRRLPLDDYGTWRQLTLVQTLALNFVTFNLPNTLLYFLPRSTSDEERRAWLAHVFQVTVVLALVVCSGVWVSAPLLARQFGNPQLSAYLPSFALNTALMSIAGIGFPLLVATQRVKGAFFLNAASAVLSLSVTVFVASVLPRVSTLVHLTVMSSFVQMILSVLLVFRMAGRILLIRPSKAQLRAIAVYAIPLGLTSAVGYLSWQVDQITVSSVFTPAQFAVYAAGSLEVPFVGTLVTSVTSVLVPHVAALYAKGDIDGIFGTWHEILRKTSLIVFPVFVGFMVVSGDLFTVMYGPKYDVSSLIFRVYLLILPLRITTYGSVLQAIGRPDISLASNVFTLTLGALLNWLLVRQMGIMGPAVATVITTYTLNGTYLTVIGRLLKTKFTNLFPWAGLASDMVLAIVPGVVALALLFVGPGTPIVRIIAVTLVYGLVYIGLLLITNRLSLARVWQFIKAPSI